MLCRCVTLHRQGTVEALRLQAAKRNAAAAAAALAVAGTTGGADGSSGTGIGEAADINATETALALARSQEAEIAAAAALLEPAHINADDLLGLLCYVALHAQASYLNVIVRNNEL